MKIIEKLGLTHGKLQWSNDYQSRDLTQTWSLLGEDGYGILSCDGECNSPQSVASEYVQIIATAPEMFLWIIGMMKAADNNDMLKAAKLLEVGSELIEQATGKTWEKIKELFNE